jgi:hypothetical protein
MCLPCVPCTPLYTQAEFRSIVFALCYFHAALLERKKFGVGNLPGATSGIGWNMNYPFNTGDLLCCGQCASNYLENNVKVCFGGHAGSQRSTMQRNSLEGAGSRGLLTTVHCGLSRTCVQQGWW